MAYLCVNTSLSFLSVVIHTLDSIQAAVATSLIIQMNYSCRKTIPITCLAQSVSDSGIFHEQSLEWAGWMTTQNAADGMGAGFRTVTFQATCCEFVLLQTNTPQASVVKPSTCNMIAVFILVGYVRTLSMACWFRICIRITYGCIHVHMFIINSTAGFLTLLTSQQIRAGLKVLDTSDFAAPGWTETFKRWGSLFLITGQYSLVVAISQALVKE